VIGPLADGKTAIDKNQMEDVFIVTKVRAADAVYKFKHVAKLSMECVYLIAFPCKL